MKISVVTVCFNSAKTIRATIESFLAQSHADKELVVVDGGSTDDTAAIVASYRDPSIRFASEADRGIYDAMNKGLARFTGDAVGFLNADDAFHDDDVLGAVARGLEQADVVCGGVDFHVVLGDGRCLRRWRPTAYRPGAFARGWSLPHPGLYCRRAIVERTGPFDTTFKVAADYEWILRVHAVTGARSVVVDRTFVDMTLGGVSTAGPKAVIFNAYENFRARRRWLGPISAATGVIGNVVIKLGQLQPLGSRRPG